MAAVAPERAGAPAAVPFEKNKDESMLWRTALVVLCPVLGVLLLFVPAVEEDAANPNPTLHEVTTNAILIILTALVIISLTFEAIEEGLEHMLDDVFLPVLNALNNELMGLGFLAVIMYFVLHFGVLITIGEYFLCANCDPCISSKEKYNVGVSGVPAQSRLLGSAGTCDPCSGKTLEHPIPGFDGATVVNKNVRCGRRLFETREQYHARAWGAEAWETHRALGGSYTGQCLEIHCNEALLHMFEDLHMCLFLTLVCFFARALILLHQVNSTAKEWDSFETECKHSGGEDKIVSEYNSAGGGGLAHRKLEFMMLRKRFLDSGGSGDEKLDTDFSFSEYLQMCASEVATEVVEIPPKEWIAMEVFFVLIWACLMAPQWMRPRIFFAYTFAIFALVSQIQGKLTWVLEQVTPPFPKAVGASAVQPEGAAPSSIGKPPYQNNAWAKMRLKAHKAKEAAKSHGHGHGHGGHGHGHGHAKHVNLQDALFWNNDPELLLDFVRFSILVLLVFFVILGWYMLPYAAKKGAAYVIPACVPIPFVVYIVVMYPKDFVRQFTLATSVELLKSAKNIKRTLRATQLRKSLRAIKLLRSLQNQQAMMASKDDEAALNMHALELTPEEKKRKAELKEVFDVFDVSGDGEVDEHELGDLMVALGIELDDEEKAQLMAEFDEDKSGSISFDEFFMYMRRRQTPGDPKKLVEDIFKFIDADGSGEVTAQEFKDVINGLKTGMSEEEIMGLVREIDTSGDGTISIDEFAAVLERYS